MKKKRRLILFIMNFIAAILAAGSAWLQWWDGAWPATTDSAQLLTSANIDPVNFLPFSVAMVILVVAGLILAAALTGWKLLGFFGAIIGGTVVVLWFVNSGVGLDSNLFSINNVERVGYGTLAMIASVVVAVIALFIPGKRVKEK
ncbi:hypothetical protein FWG95_01100 [Candidatus Saccharibacteria bacterium]|nr:hypothetical protein [Candidatus Saccharibacteria bacterium]